HAPLAHPAAQLVRVGVGTRGRIGDARFPEQRDSALPRLAPGDAQVREYPFGDLVTHAEYGIEAGHRVLEDHPDAPAPERAERVALEREHIRVRQPDLAVGLDTAGCGDE